jgi:hypothetical protein
MAQEIIDNISPATGGEYTVGAKFTAIQEALKDEATNKCLSNYGFHISLISPATLAQQDFDNSQFPDLKVISHEDQFGPYS